MTRNESATDVYFLKPNTTDPRFDGFTIAAGATSVLGNKRAYQDFLVDSPGSLDWKPKQLKHAWTSMPVEGPVRPFNDFPCFELIEPAFSHRAVSALGELLTANGELLPLLTKVGEYYAYNLLTKIDALDLGKTVLRPSNRPDRPAAWIDFFEFKQERIADASIFRVPQQPQFYFVTSVFRDRVLQAKLNGFVFKKVWPLPEGADWDDRSSRTKTRTKVLGHALVLHFPLQNARPGDAEQQAAADIERSLRRLLEFDAESNTYWGSIESTDFEKGVFRIACSCPDCEDLLGHIRGWLEDVPWNQEITVVMRFGNLFTAGVKETKQLISKH